MRGVRAKRIMVLLLCMGFSCLLAAAIRFAAHGETRAVDFAEVYFGGRCALDHKDAYDPRTVLREFQSDGGKLSMKNADKAQGPWTIVATDIYPPSALLVVAPFAMLPWPLASSIWLWVIAALLVLAAFLEWDLGSDAPVISGSLAGFILLNCVVLLAGGNPAGVVAPLCVIAAWCFIKDRYTAAGVGMLAMALALKPHDAGFVWLFFLLAGGKWRKHALQTLGIAGVLAAGSVVWIVRSSPNWFRELRDNLAVLSVHGGLADPGPSGGSTRIFSPVVSLQSTVSLFKDSPRFYNPVSYLIVGGLILIWALAVLRKRSSFEGAVFALAAVSALTMLPVYHRADDAKLLLLTLPACALVWVAGGKRRWVALVLTSAGIFVTSADPLILVYALTAAMPISTATLGGKLMFLALQPAPVILLATGCFYVWVYVRYEPSPTDAADVRSAGRLAQAAT